MKKWQGMSVRRDPVMADNDDFHPDLGTVRWFGRTWSAPINDPRAEVEVPDDECLAGCHQPFVWPLDQGVSIPYINPEEGRERANYHLDCWMSMLGISAITDAMELLDEDAR